MSIATRPRVLCADDHPLILNGLCRILDFDFEVIGAVADGEALVAATRRLLPDAVVSDISMPRLTGLEAFQRVQTSMTPPKWIFLTMHADQSTIQMALRLGASGFVPKHSPADEVILAIREALKGRVYLSPSITRDVIAYWQQEETRAEPPAALSDREMEVVRLLAEGYQYKEVANLLSISVKTVEFHRHNAIEKLGLRSTSELTRYALKSGLVPL